MERRRRRAIVAVRLPLVLTPLRPFHTPARPVHGPQVRQRREPPGLDRPQDQHQDPDEILRADGPLPMRPVTDVIVGRSMVRHTQQSDQMAPAFDGVRKAEGGEGATGEIAWVPFGVGRSADGLGPYGRLRELRCAGWRENTQQGTLSDRAGASLRGSSVFRWVGRSPTARRQAGSGMARSRAKARLNFSAQGQRSGRCRVNRRAERVSRPAREKNRRRRVLVVTIC